MTSRAPVPKPLLPWQKRLAKLLSPVLALLLSMCFVCMYIIMDVKKEHGISGTRFAEVTRTVVTFAPIVVPACTIASMLGLLLCLVSLHDDKRYWALQAEAEKGDSKPGKAGPGKRQAKKVN